MLSVKNVKVEHAQDWLNLALAVILFASPWVLGFQGETVAAWTAWGAGVVIAILAAAAIVQFAEWEEWASLALGLMLAAAPWALGYSDIVAAQWASFLLGLLVAMVALWEVQIHRSAPR
ncbi:MAG: SPW repeat protein [Proteobacteria bacterium]|nr:SPW repeat protein [Pseudomonadota bacterium]